jgi:membrane protease subunit HflC
MKKHLRGIGIIVIFLGLWLIFSTVYVVSEGQRALIIRLGAPIAVSEHPGLKLKIPFIDSVVFYDIRLQTLAPPPDEVILGDEKRLDVESFTLYRIVDPLRFYQTLGTQDQADIQLENLVSSSLRRELGTVTLKSLLTTQRTVTVTQIQQEVARKARPLGIQVDEVRLHRADLPQETSQAIYDRMKSERQREAQQLRAQGAEWGQQIQAQADGERVVILSEAERQSAITRGDGDAEANQILAKAYSRDPKFYKFFRSLQTYSQTLAGSSPTLILSPDSALLHDFKSGPTSAK